MIDKNLSGPTSYLQKQDIPYQSVIQPKKQLHKDSNKPLAQ